MSLNQKRQMHVYKVGTKYSSFTACGVVMLVVMFTATHVQAGRCPG